MLKIIDTRKVAKLIVSELNKRGAGLGGMSVIFVMQTLDELEAAQQEAAADIFTCPTHGKELVVYCPVDGCDYNPSR